MDIQEAASTFLDYVSGAAFLADWYLRDEFKVGLGDLAIALFLIAFACRGIYRGVMRDLVSIGQWVTSIFTALVALNLVAPLLPTSSRYASVTVVVCVLGLICTFAVSEVAVRRWFREVMQITFPGSRILGLLSGTMRGWLIICLAYMLLNAGVPFDQQPKWVNTSCFLYLVQISCQAILYILP